MDASELPTDVEQLKALLVSTLAVKERELKQARFEATQFKHEVNELSSSVAEQEKKLSAREQTIRELLAALRGKTRERIDPDQLLLFEIGELETLIEESLAAEKVAARPKSRKKRGRRLIPDNIPTETIEYQLADEERRCPIDGQVMPRIGWEESTQLDYVPAQIKKIIHRRAVYAHAVPSMIRRN